MKKKSTILNPRFLIPLAVLLLFYIGCGVYVLQVSGVNTVEYGREGGYVEGTIRAVSSDERVLRVKKITEVEKEYGTVALVETEGVSPGDAVLSVKYSQLSESDEKTVNAVDTKVMMCVTPFGMVYNRSMDTFTGLEIIMVMAIGTMLIIASGLVASLIRKFRNGEFTYSMVDRCGLAIFFIINSAVVFHECLDMQDLEMPFSLWLATQILFDSGQLFVMLSLMPLAILAFALALSNLWLVRHEGFRPMNLLGVFLGVVMMGGIVVMTIMTSHMYYQSVETLFQSSESYYLAAFMSIAFSFIYCYFECMLLSTIVCAILSTRYKPAYDLDYIIILGCAIRGDGTPTPLLRGRVDRALQFEKEQHDKTGKHAKFVPSGGQGSDEVISEAESMKRYLMEQGVPEERIIKEDRSVNTLQNMAFSKKVIEGDAGSLDDVNVGFSTTNYHVFRGYTLADRIRMKVEGLSAKTKLYFFPNAFIREFIGLLWEKKFRHIMFIVLLTLGLGALYYVAYID